MRRRPSLLILALACIVAREAHAEPVRITGFRLARQATNALRFDVDVSAAGPASAYVEFWRADDSGDTLVRTAISPPAASHRIVLIGCRADTAYEARAVVFGPLGRAESETLRFRTGPLPQGLEDLRLVSSTGTARGYVLTDEVDFPLSARPQQAPGAAPTDGSLENLRALGYVGAGGSSRHAGTGAQRAPVHSDWLRIVDRAGRVVWYEHFDTLAGFSLAVDRTISVAVRSPDGATRRVLSLGLDGRPRLDIDIPELPTHDILKDPRGNMVFLTAEARRVDRRAAGGRADEVVVGDGLAVYDPGGRRLWRWTSFDAFDPVRLRGQPNRFWEPVFGADAEDWLHANSLCLDRDGNYVISLRHHDMLIKIDGRTGRLLWRLGRDGDIRLPAAAGFIGQHAVTLTPRGDFMIFDNGDARRGWSRALALRVDEIKRQASIAWEYRLPVDLYSFAISSACEIAGGHRLICSGVPGVLLELDASDRVVWQAASRPGLSLYRAFALAELYDEPPDIEFRSPLVAVSDASRPIALTASPPGGYFSGPGVEGALFDPARAGPGGHVIRYSHGWRTQSHRVFVVSRALVGVCAVALVALLGHVIVRMRRRGEQAVRGGHGRRAP